MVVENRKINHYSGMAVLETTQNKLEEARFFLGKLTEASRAFVGEEAAAFPFYLSAFVSAARSVGYTLQCEHKNLYDTWFPKWEARLTEDKKALHKLINTQRNEVLKEGRAKTTVSLEHVSLTDASSAEKRQAIVFQWTGPPGTPTPVVVRRVRSFDLNGTPVEVVETCLEYYKHLELLLADFRASHNF